MILHVYTRVSLKIKRWSDHWYALYIIYILIIYTIYMNTRFFLHGKKIFSGIVSKTQKSSTKDSLSWLHGECVRPGCDSLPIPDVREDLPVLDQHLLPDDLAHDLHADAKQVGEWGVRVVEAVQQNLRHLSLLSPYQPERIRIFAM